MTIIPKPLNFEWDDGNIDKNYIKHLVTNSEAEEVFQSEFIFYFKDVKHSTKEERDMLWGQTFVGRRLIIIFTKRRKTIRIISARDMNKKERSFYEEKFQNHS